MTAGEANEELRAIEAGVARDFAQSHARAELVFREMHEALYGPFKPALMLLLGGVGFLLLIACTNVANLALGRVAERRGEISLRLSLGAGTRRILQYQLTESAIVATVGCLAGAALALWALPAFVAIYPAALPADIDGAVQPRVIAIVSALMVASTGLAGLAPAWRASRVPAGGVLAQTTLRTAGHARDRRTREWLLAAQLACAVILLSTGGRRVRELRAVESTDPGFDYQNVLTLQLAPARYPQPQARAQFVSRVLDRIKEIPAWSPQARRKRRGSCCPACNPGSRSKAAPSNRRTISSSTSGTSHPATSPHCACVCRTAVRSTTATPSAATRWPWSVNRLPTASGPDSARLAGASSADRPARSG